MIVLSFLGLGTAMAAADFCTHDQLATQDRKALRITRNTVFARHGRAFKSSDLQAHFKSKSWYTIRSDYRDSMLSDEDKKCVERVVLWEKSRGSKKLAVDLTGDGKAEGVYLFDTRPKAKGNEGVCEKKCAVHVGYGRFTHKIGVHWKRGAYFDKMTLASSNIDTSTPQKEIYLQHSQPWMEDPARNTVFMWIYNGQAYQKEAKADYYNAGDVNFSKKGHVGIEDADDCVISKTSWYRLIGAKMTKEGVDYRKDLSGGFMIEGGNGEYGCPACPYVYLKYAENSLFLGEILRYQIGVEALRWDSIRIPSTASTIHIEIAEEKPEITYLDTLHLQIGDVKISPISCEDGKHDWCQQDNKYWILHPDERRIFEFVVPEKH